MAVAVKIDILDGTEVRDTIDGFFATRIAIVTGLTGPSHGRFESAVRQRGIPALGSPHPSFPQSFLVARLLRAMSPSTVVMALEYGPPDFFLLGKGDASKAQLVVGATLQTVTTDRDFEGNRLFVTYKDSNEKVHKQFTRVELQVPMVMFEYSRVEAESPGDKAKAFVGAVNSTNIFGDGPRTWKCMGIVGRSFDGGATYEVNYSFQRADETWDVGLEYVDPETGEPPSDATDTNGRIVIDVHRKKKDFNQLNLLI